MANSDKDIKIIPNTNQAGVPTIQFIGSSSVPISLNVLDNTSISFSSSAGQLFSINNNLTEGTIFSVNDVSGIPSIEVDADGTVSIAELGGNVGIGTSNPTYKLEVVGAISASNYIGIPAAGGTVTSVTAGSNLDGGTITDSGTISLSTTLTGLDSVTATSFTGSLEGNASTATIADTLTNMNISQFTNNSGYAASLDELTDVDVSTVTPVNGEALVYNNGTWSAQAITAAGTSVTADNIANATRYLTFSSVTAGATSILTDTGLTYNPSSNTLTAGTFVETSAREYKTDIETMSNQLENLKKLNPVSYIRIADNKKELGLIAEEVNEIYPEFVVGKGINYPKMVSVLISSVQELSAKVEKQQDIIEKLLKVMEQ